VSDKVFFTRQWPGTAVDLLRRNGFEVEVWPEFDRPATSEISQRVADGLFGLVTTVEDPITAATLEAESSNLKIVAQAGVGYDNLDVNWLTSRGVWVTNTPGVLDDATADLAFALMCALARHIPAADRYVRDGLWTCWHPSLFLGTELSQATVGIVGMGRIGEAFARRCKGFDMRILYTGRSEKPTAKQLAAEFCSLEDLLRQSDIVSLHVPLTDATRGLINDERLEMMKPDALLINTARGAVIDQAALTRALVGGKIQGAALDVTDPEPLPADHPLLEAPNLLIAPHIGSAGKKTRERMAEIAAENIVVAARGERPPNALRELR
jgi:glyoxylate reductase